jgi:hypothetical protein
MFRRAAVADAPKVVSDALQRCNEAWFGVSQRRGAIDVESHVLSDAHARIREPQVVVSDTDARVVDLQLVVSDTDVRIRES